MKKKELHGYKFAPFVLLFFILIFTSLGEIALPNQPTVLFTHSGISDTIVVITPKKSRVFYHGMQNPIVIAVKGMKISNIKISIDNGTIKGQNGEYNVSPSKWGNVTIYVAVGNKIIHKQAFRVKSIPDPVACVNGFSGKSALTKAEIIDAAGLVVNMFGFEFAPSFKITHFTLSASGTYSEPLSSSSNRFTNEQLAIIKNAKRGSTIYFGNIHAVGSDGSSRKLPTFRIKLK